VSSRNVKWLIVMMSLVTVATVHAAPTIGDNDAKIAQAVLPYSDGVNACANEVNLFSGTADTALAKVAVDILKPPADFTNPSALPLGTKSLPAVPAALFMGLTGFLCVTLVRDRKVWLAALTTILWAGQIGITTLPQKCRVCFAHHLNKRWAVPTLPYLGEQASRLRSDLEGTEYVGLLHHLEGIPSTLRDTRYAIRDTRHEIRTKNIAAVNSVYTYLIQAFNYLSYDVRQFTCFSPAFIFNSIPRGPPTLA